MSKFKVPETIADLGVDKLQALEEQAVAAFDELKADPNLDAAGLAQLQRIAKFVADVRAQLAKLEAEAEKTAEQFQAEVEAATALVHPTGAEDVEPAATASQGGDDVVEGEIVEGAPEKMPVLAGGAARAAAARSRAVGRRGPRSQPTTDEPMTAHRVRAVADLPKFSNGEELTSLDMLAQAFESRLDGFPRRPSSGRFPVAKTRLKHGVAVIEKAMPDALVADGMSFWELMDEIGDERKLRGGNVIASGGWCAPNVRVWDLCPGLETTEGIADFPSFRLERGGIEYPANLEFRDIYSDANLDFHQTEAESISGTDKVCYAIPCPTFSNARLEIDGICFSQDIVKNAVWPELTRDVIRRAMIAHDHKVNARLLAQVFTIAAGASTAYTLTLGSDMDGDTTTTGVLGAVALGAVDYRYRYRMLRGATLEGFAPIWLLDWIRADMARRAGVDFFSVTDAMINGWLAVRGIRLQWVYDLQDGYVNGGGAGFGGTAPPGQWPATVKIALFAAGTWSKGGNGIIDLSAVYDSTGLKDNQYTAAFTEESVLLLRRCQASYVLTIPLCPSGAGPQPVSFDCVAA